MTRVLFICTQNMLRSPTGEQIYTGRQGVEARSAGISSGAIEVVSEKQLLWADKIFVMEERHHKYFVGPHDVLDDRVRAMIHYAEVLTLNPQMIEPARIDELRAVGLDDGDILELNQVISYFAYANRTVLGLGVITEGDRIGLSPGNQDDPDDWRHA